MTTDDGKLPAIVEALSGSVGASLANVLVYPLDLVTARIQTQGPKTRAVKGNSGPGKNESLSTSRRSRDDYGNLFAALQTIYRTHDRSFGAFYQGITSDTLSTATSQFLYFYLFAALTKLYERQTAKAGKAGGGAAEALAKASVAKDLLIGAVAGIISRGVTTPLSTITVRKQTAAKITEKPASEKDGDEEQKLGWSSSNGGGRDDSSEEADANYAADSSIAIAKDIYDEHGLAGFWRGYKSACILTVNPALTFYFISAFQAAIIPKRFRDKPTPAQTFFTSAFASAIASAVCYPLILTKTRLQWKSPSGKLMYKNMTDVIVKTVKRGGISGLYVGLQTQIIKGFISQGVTMLVKQRAEFLIVYLYRLLQQTRRQRISA